MNDIRIIFGAPGGVDCPDGTCLGVQGEHNAARLVITLPAGMIEGVTHHVVRYQLADKALSTAPITEEPNAEGAYRDGCTLYVPLTKDVTNTLTLSLRVLAMTKLGSADGILDSTEPVQGLYFHAADGSGDSALPDTVRREEHFHLLASHGLYEIDTIDELDEFPCTTIKPGERVYLRNLCRRYDDMSGGLVPQLSKTYRACFFLKNLLDVFTMFGERFLHKPETYRDAWYELMTLARSNGDTYRVQFLYHDVFGSYVVQVTPHTREAFEARTESYYYVPRDRTFTLDPWSSYIGGTYTMYAGWNREYTVDVDDYRRSLAYEKVDTPPAFFDAVCTQLTVDPPEDFDTSLDFSLMPFLVSLNCPTEHWAPAGIYTCRTGAQDVYLATKFRRIRFTIRADEDAWSDGKQTIIVPTASYSDIYSPVYKGEENPYSDIIGWRYTPLSTYGIKVVEVGAGLITVAKTSEYSLTEDKVFEGSLRRIHVANTRDYYELDDHAHDYTDEGVVTVQPTCTKEGSSKHTCACGAEKTVAVPALGHDWGEWEVTTEPTQETDGVETRTCSRCGAAETRAVPRVLDPDPITEDPLDGSGGAPAVDSCEHQYGDEAPAWSTNADYTEVAATFTCVKCGHQETVIATIAADHVDETDERMVHYIATVEHPNNHTHHTLEYTWYGSLDGEAVSEVVSQEGDSND